MRRRTAYVEVCPGCGAEQEYNDEEKWCEWCGWNYGPDWETVEIDIDTGLVLRTIIAPKARAGES